MPLLKTHTMHEEIARSRIKMIGCLLACGIFVVASLAIISVGSALTLIIGALGLLTFTAFGIGWIVLLFRSDPGLVVDNTGFHDASSLSAVGRVAWADVRGMSQLRLSGASFVIVDVRDPEAYVARLRGVSRLAGIVNHRMFGSPITVGSVGLQTDFTGLSELMHEGLRRHNEPWLEPPR